MSFTSVPLFTDQKFGVIDFGKTLSMGYKEIKFPAKTANKPADKCNKNPDILLDYAVFTVLIGVSIGMLW